jgi:two-component system nitrogen regulation sensor histidine kinase GlnL
VSENLSDAIWGSIPYPAIVVGGDDLIEAANTATEFFGGASLRQMLGQPLARFAGYDSPVLKVVAQARQDVIPIARYDVIVAWSKMQPQSYNVHAVPLPDQPEKVLILLHPQGMAEKLDRNLSHRSAARSVTGMAAMLAHEIRNPLAGISGAAQLLEMGLLGDDLELTRLIRSESDRIGNLVDRMEQFGDLRPAQRQAVNLHDVLDRARRAALAGFAAHLRISEEYDPSLPPAAGDPDQLMQVFQNLLKNAAEAVPDVGGIISIKTSFRPGVRMIQPGGVSESLPLVVSVTDNGPGIPENLIHDIFDPFVSSKINGTGLGLSLVSKLISDHGGVVECDSAPGRASFLVRLPVWREQIHEPEA